MQANFAKWEPGHGKFRFRHPWDLYLKVGALSRQCAYRMEALDAHINSDIQVYIMNLINISFNILRPSKILLNSINLYEYEKLLYSFTLPYVYI